jgi:hypothetical protein
MQGYASRLSTINGRESISDMNTNNVTSDDGLTVRCIYELFEKIE